MMVCMDTRVTCPHNIMEERERDDTIQRENASTYKTLKIFPLKFSLLIINYYY